MSYNDYRDIFRLMEREMQQFSDEVFRGFFDTTGASGRFWHPPVDIYESENALLVKIELPGVKSEELQVALSSDNRVLTVSGMRKEPEGERRGRLGCHQLEIYFGPFERSITLPASITVHRDEIKAIYRDGFLVVTLPKRLATHEDESRIIPITTEDGHRTDSEEADEPVISSFSDAHKEVVETV